MPGAVVLTLRVLALLLLVPSLTYAAADGNTEQRCKDIDAMGGANECVCSEPLITNGTWTTGFWDPPGSTTKECDGEGGYAMHLQNQTATTGMHAVASWYTVPSGAGVSYVFLQEQSAEGTNNFYGSYWDGNRSVPTDVGRVCHRALVRLSSDFTGRNDANPAHVGSGISCTGVKVYEFNPSGSDWFQYQGGLGSPSVEPEFTAFFTGASKHTGSNFFTHTEDGPPADLALDDCRDGWCGFEQCWYGNFATGAIVPIARTYVLNATTGAIERDLLHTFLGTMTATAATPVTFDADRILNLFKQDLCPGTRAIIYGMEAEFATADDGTGAHGPWIGPPVEFAASDTAHTGTGSATSPGTTGSAAGVHTGVHSGTGAGASPATTSDAVGIHTGAPAYCCRQ